MNVVVFSCSLNPNSRSHLLAEAAVERLHAAEAGVDVQHFDLRELQLPMCDGRPGEPDIIDAAVPEAIRGADAILLAVPVYNYSINSAAKNLIELTGRAWQDRLVGFLCAAGGRGSYMSVMGIANSLMLDFRCMILPRFVYADGGSFEGRQIDPGILERIDGLVADVVRVGGALAETGTANKS